jgi:hypothetical protein
MILGQNPGFWTIFDKFPGILMILGVNLMFFINYFLLFFTMSICLNLQNNVLQESSTSSSGSLDLVDAIVEFCHFLL